MGKLSQRATDYLKTLERVSRVSPEKLKVLMREQGIEPLEVWLAFQENYAGYLEWIAKDGAVWGIVHDQKRFFEYPEPFIIEHDYYPHENARVVNCADVHGTYDYTLTEHGVFLGGPTDRFEVYVEQLALWQDFIDQNPNAAPTTLFNNTAFDARLESEAVVVPEASDTYHTYALGDDILGIKDKESGRWIRVLLAHPPPKPIKESKRGLFGSILKDLKDRVQR